MFSIQVTIEGVAPLLMHRYPMPEFGTLSKGGRQVSGSRDFTEEWRDYFYADAEGNIYQPSAHIEGAMIKAAANFRVTGKRGKTYKDIFQSSIFVTPEKIPHGMKVPDQLDADADKPLYLDLRPVVVQRARVVRMRPAFKAGWRLSFEIECIDDQIAPTLVQDVLSYAGRAVGIGDFRPRCGRFFVSQFEKQLEEVAG